MRYASTAGWRARQGWHCGQRAAQRASGLKPYAVPASSPKRTRTSCLRGRRSHRHDEAAPVSGHEVIASDEDTGSGQEARSEVATRTSRPRDAPAAEAAHGPREEAALRPVPVQARNNAKASGHRSELDWANTSRRTARCRHSSATCLASHCGWKGAATAAAAAARRHAAVPPAVWWWPPAEAWVSVAHER